jgi:uncharacterized protein (DUF305 family)
MKTTHISFARNGFYAAIAAACLATAAVAQTPAPKPAASAPMQGQMPGHMPGQMPGMSHGGKDMKSMMKGMNDEMANMTMSGDPDVDFAKMMRIHHVGALDMANAHLKEGKNPQMLKLAKEIIAAQKKEIALMDKFIATHPHPAGKAVK